MTKPYFRQVPNFEYVSRDSDAKNISDYVPVKNLFKRGKLREDIFGNLAFFEKYSIIGDERPDNVAFKFYGDATLDWVILLSNNILNIQDEWPMTQVLFDKVMLEKYESYENLYSGTHHFETKEVKNSLGVTIIPAGIQVDEFEYNDNGEKVKRSNIIPITNYEFERRIEEEKRNIYILKSRYLNVVFNDMEDLMIYKKGGDQYVTDTLKRGDNIRLFY
jgi:hypothetical protein